MKKRMRKAGILLVVFVAAIFVSSLFMNNGVDDQIIDLGDPTLPRISFQKEGRTVNALAGYVNEMDRKPIWKANRRIFLMRRFCWI